MPFPIPWAIPSPSTIQHKIKHKKTLISTYQTNGTMASQGIYTNTPTRLRHLLPPYYLLLNIIHPDPGNKWWVLLNMARSHRKTNYKVSTRVKNYCQRSPRPTETTTSYIIRGKCTTFIKQGSKNEVLLQLFVPTEKYILTLLRNLQFNHI